MLEGMDASELWLTLRAKRDVIMRKAVRATSVMWLWDTSRVTSFGRGSGLVDRVDNLFPRKLSDSKFSSRPVNDDVSMLSRRFPERSRCFNLLNPWKENKGFV